MKKSKKALALALATVMAVSAFAGCGGDTPTDSTTTTPQATSNTNTTTPAVTDSTTTTATTTEPATKLSILLPYGDHANDELDLTIEFRRRLEEYTNTDITWELYDATSYYEKLTLKYASGELSSIMVTDQNAEFLSACKYNVFWDVTDYIDLFDNLATIPEATRMNASINGTLYGVPRSRTVGRNAPAYRQDWADNLGLGHPETLDDLYEMAVQFTNNDPDGNGKNDTYGFALDGWTGQWNIMLPWFGVPNVWGLDESGKLEYYAMTEEYKTALKWFRQIYSEGLMPENFRSTNPGSADKSLLRTNIAGISIQVADTASRAVGAMNGTAEAPGLYPEARFTYFSAVDAGYGINVLPTAGYAGYVALARSELPTEADMLKALQFLNDINDAEMQNLIGFGLEGIDYYMDDNGYAVRYTNDEKLAKGISTASYREGYNQMVPYFATAEESAKVIGVELTEQKKAEAAIQAANMQYVVPNYGASYTSETYTAIGTDLDAILTNAMLDYIEGIIDETGLQAALDQWLEAGGQTVIDEMNALYEKYN